jgi:capsular exopolysaccharide synthesis family protein
VVSSAVPSEGKTATATNLAITLTQIGSRVLMIDADMRKPRLGAIFNLKMKPGLSNFLTGSDPLKSVIHASAVPNLYVMPCGAIPPNPSELLMSTRFRHMMKTLQGYFDYVIIDSPPLNNVSDGRILAALVDGVVFVTKASMTARNLAMRALEQIDDYKGRVLGVVINDYDLHRMSSYYYLYYSGRYHSYYQYYSSSDNAKQIANS